MFPAFSDNADAIGAALKNYPLPVRLAVSRSSVVQMGGAPWRSASLDLTEFGGITVSCLAAHQLPNGLPDGYRR